MRVDCTGASLDPGEPMRGDRSRPGGADGPRADSEQRGEEGMRMTAGPWGRDGDGPGLSSAQVCTVPLLEWRAGKAG